MDLTPSPPRFSDDEDDEEFSTTAQVLNKFEEIWQNEKFSPELLPYEEELVTCLKEQINHMKDNLEQLKPGDLRKDVHQMELNRISYMLSSYLRIRLEKVGKFGSYLLDRENSNSTEIEAGSLMAPPERVYAIEYVALVDDFLKKNVIEKFPTNLGGFDLSKSAAFPNLDSYIFLQVKQNTGGVVIEDQMGNVTSEEIVDFVKGNQHIMKYRPISGLLKTGKIKLI